MIKKVLTYSALAILLLIGIFLLGPKARFLPVDKTPIVFDIPLESLEEYIAEKESEVLDIKPGNEARIVWADSTKQRTEYSIVYLHGFSASHEEGAPLHTDFAQRYGCNLYLSRLFDHGRSSDDMFKNLTPEDLVNSAKEAIAIARLLGNKIIVMSCSTGGTFSNILAPFDDDIYAMMMYSPNIDVYDQNAKLITGPWGVKLLELVMGGKYQRVKYNDLGKKYWSSVYHTDGLVALKYLIDQEMTEDNFRKIDKPLYMGYYYENEENQDKVVSVPRMLEFYEQISTPLSKKRKESFPKSKRHVMTSYVFSKDIENVIHRAYDFAEEVLNLSPIEN